MFFFHLSILIILHDTVSRLKRIIQCITNVDLIDTQWIPVKEHRSVRSTRHNALTYLVAN